MRFLAPACWPRAFPELDEISLPLVRSLWVRPHALLALVCWPHATRPGGTSQFLVCFLRAAQFRELGFLCVQRLKHAKPVRRMVSLCGFRWDGSHSCGPYFPASPDCSWHERSTGELSSPQHDFPPGAFPPDDFLLRDFQPEPTRALLSASSSEHDKALQRPWRLLRRVR